MKQFDYTAAWREVAKPAFETLSPEVIALLAQVAKDSADLSQLKDCSMPWPETDLKRQFEKVPTADLAFAARVINSAGHWFPTDGELDMPGKKIGAHWRFSHYADQILRERLGVKGETPFQIHEGAIRLCYSSRDMWVWEEVAPADSGGLANATALCSQRPGSLKLTREERDNAMYQWYEELKKRDLGWPENWKPFMDTEHYMRDEQAIKAQKKPTLKDREAIVKHCAQVIEEATTERDGLVWLIDHGIHTENVIFYKHVPVFSFGWREPVIDSVRDEILAVISEFPFPYQIKCADKKTLEGNIE